MHSRTSPHWGLAWGLPAQPEPAPLWRLAPAVLVAPVALLEAAAVPVLVLVLAALPLDRDARRRVAHAWHPAAAALHRSTTAGQAKTHYTAHWLWAGRAAFMRQRMTQASSAFWATGQILTGSMCEEGERWRARVVRATCCVSCNPLPLCPSALISPPTV